MKWNKYTIKTTTQAEDLISSVLVDLGVEGVEIEDNVPLSAEDKEKLYIDILPELPPDLGIAYVSFFLEYGEGQEELIRLVKEGMQELRRFTDVGEGTITVDVIEDKDFINNWKQYFKSFVLEGILIKPSWEEMPAEGGYDYVVEVDPGTSFGTGKHETTQLCIRQLKKYMNENDCVLDVGCGSGILSAISLKLGAGQVTGTDIDPLCIEASRENMQINGFPHTNFRDVENKSPQWEFYFGNLIGDKELQQKVGTGYYDIAVANILADVIIPLTPVIVPYLKEGGIYIASGIIDFKEDPVKRAMEEAGFVILEVCRQGEWVSITARKQGICINFL